MYEKVRIVLKMGFRPNPIHGWMDTSEEYFAVASWRRKLIRTRLFAVRRGCEIL